MTMLRSDWLWLSGILVLAAVLRAINLDAGLWYDEIVTLVEYVRVPARELVTTYTSFNNHILFSLEAQASIALLGESAWSLRLPALIFGVASVGALWWLARLVATPWEAHLSALLMAVSYHHVWFSQNARGYTGILFWSLLATIIFLRNIERPSWRSWVGYAFVLAAAVYTHLTAAFFFAAQGIVYVALCARQALRIGEAGRAGHDPLAGISGVKPLFGFALGGVLALALYAPLLPQILEKFGEVATPPVAAVVVSEWKNPIWTVLEIVRSVRDMGPLMSVALPAALAFVSIGVVSFLRHQPVFAAFFVVHIPLTLAVLLTLSFNVWPRFFFVDMGFILLSLLRGVFVVAGYFARILKTRERWRVTGDTIGILVSLTGVLVSLLMLPVNYRYPKQDFIGARDFIESHRSAGDRVASVGLASVAFSSYYAPKWEVLETREELDRLRASGRTWVVYAFPGHTALNYPAIMASIATDFELATRLRGTLGNGDVWVYRSRK
jgi:hypothetical protein